jgi:hypothetical protein
MTHCRNCKQGLPAEAVYCPVCGQSVKAIVRPWREAIREVSSELLDFDGRMLHSFRLLITRPGFLSFEYIQGRRVSYTSPLRMYLVISLLFFLILPMILPPSTGAVTNPDHTVSADNYSQAMFLLLPIFALLLKLFYRKTYYLAHLVFAVHLFSAMFMAFALMLSFESFADSSVIGATVQVLIFFAMLAYSVMALKTTYGESWIKSTLKFLGLFAVFLPIIGGAIELASHIGSF